MWWHRPAHPKAKSIEAPVVMAEGFEIGGRLSLSRPAVLNGRLSGVLVSTSSIVVGPTATVHADIRATSVTVRGEVIGDITAAQWIKLESGARVTGDLEAPEITIGAGAFFEGDCRMVRTPDERTQPDGEADVEKQRHA